LKTVVQKATLRQLIKAGYDVDAYVLVGVTDDLSEVKAGEIAATLSFTQNAIRTIKQNAAIHLFCEMVSESLNAAGWTKKKYFEAKNHDDVDWTQASVKEDIWRHIQTALFPDKKSTTQLETKDVSRVSDNVNRMLANSLEMPGVDFPNRLHAIKYDE
jgi:hypothetical protein